MPVPFWPKRIKDHVMRDPTFRPIESASVLQPHSNRPEHSIQPPTLYLRPFRCKQKEALAITLNSASQSILLLLCAQPQFYLCDRTANRGRLARRLASMRG